MVTAVYGTLPKTASVRKSTYKQESMIWDRTPLATDPELKRAFCCCGLEVAQTALPVQIAAREVTDIGLHA